MKLRWLLLSILMVLPCCAWLGSGVGQQTPSATYCDPARPIYMYNNHLYICANGSPSQVDGGLPTGTVPIANGGTNATTAAQALINLGATPFLLTGHCAGAVSSASSNGIALVGLGGATTSGACAGAGSAALGTILTRNCTLQNLIVRASTGGVNSSDGVFTVVDEATPLSITVTTGTATTVFSDNTHTAAALKGDRIWVQGVTQTSSTLASPAVSVECQ